jgi:hypothetical protein
MRADFRHHASGNQHFLEENSEHERGVSGCQNLTGRGNSSPVFVYDVKA